MHPYVRTLFLSMNTPGDKIPVTVKRCPLSFSWNLYQKYPLCCLTGDRTLLPVNSHQSWKRGRGREGEREREGIGGMLYSSLSLGICVYLACPHLLDGRMIALNPSVSEARAGTSCSDRTRITLETQHCDHNGGTEYEKYPVTAKRMNTWRGEDISDWTWHTLNVRVWVGASFGHLKLQCFVVISCRAVKFSWTGFCVCVSSFLGLVDFSVGFIVPQTADEDARATINHTNMPIHTHTQTIQCHTKITSALVVKATFMSIHVSLSCI